MITTEAFIYSARSVTLSNVDFIIYFFRSDRVIIICIWNSCGSTVTINTLRPRQSGRYFADDIFKCIFLNENAWISLKISLKFDPKVRIDNVPALVQIMAWRRPGDKPLSEPRMESLLTHICVTRPQWVNKPAWWLLLAVRLCGACTSATILMA